MDESKSCNHQEAIKMLFKGAFVFAEIREGIFKEKQGCRKCNAHRTGNFCSVCGSKITDKFKVKVGENVTKFRLSYHNERLSAETMKQGESFYGNRKDCTFSLEFFMNLKKLSWIWP